MKSLARQFNYASQTRQRTSTLSFRVRPEERNALEDQAGGLPMHAFPKSRVLDPKAKLPKSRGKRPVTDFEALARSLGKLGRADLHNRCARLPLAIEEGRV